MSVSSIKLSVACLLLLGVALLLVSGGAEATWEQMDDITGISSGEHVAFFYDSESDRGIVIETSHPDKSVYSYDYDTDTWSEKSDRPGNLSCSGGSKSYVGYYYDSESDRGILFESYNSCGNDVFAYDYDNDSWEEMSASPGNISSGEDFAFFYDSENDRGIVIETSGGGSAQKSVYAYDYNTDNWEQLSDRPGNLSCSNSYLGYYYDSESNRGIVFESYHSCGQDVFSYDYDNDQWEQMADGSTGSGNNIAFFYDSDNDIGIIAEISHPDSDVFSYNYNNDTWEMLEDRPGSLSCSSSVGSFYDSESLRGIAFESSSSCGGDVFALSQKFPEWSYETTGGDVNAVAVSADGEYMVAGSDDDKFYLFDKDSSTPLWNYTTGDDVGSVAISADGKYIVVGSGDVIYFFDKEDSSGLWTYTTNDEIFSVSISADGEYGVASSGDEIKFMNKEGSLWSSRVDDQVRSVSISGNGEYIAAVSYDDNVYLFNKDSSTPLWNYTAGNILHSVAISADGEYIAVGSGEHKVYLFDKDSSTPLWSYSTGDQVRTVSISADGEYIIAGCDDDKVHLFDKDSSTPLWSYTTGNQVRSVSISADGNYIIIGSWDEEVYFFSKDNSTPLWNYATGDYVTSVSVSADGKYISVGSRDDNVYSFKNSLADRDDSKSITLEGPSDESIVYSPVNLSWSFEGDDEYTFDLYLGTLTINPFVAIVIDSVELENTLPSTEKITDIHYYDGYLWFSELDNFSIKKINLENGEISVFATDTTYLKYVFDITIDSSSGKVYTVSRPSGTYSSSTKVCEWLVNGSLSGCNSSDVRYGTAIDYYSGSVFVLQTYTSTTYKKIIELSYDENDDDIDSRLKLIDSYSYSASSNVQDMVINPDNGDIWLPVRDINGTIIKLNASQDYEQTDTFLSSSRYSNSVAINDGYLYTTGWFSTDYYGGINRMNLSEESSFESYSSNFTYYHYLGQMAFDDDNNLYVSTDYRYSYYQKGNIHNLILKFREFDNVLINIDSLAFEFDTPLVEDLTSSSFNITSEIMKGSKTYYWQVVARDGSGNVVTSPIRSFYVYDITPPVSFITGPSSDNFQSSADFFLSSDKDGVSFSCKLDNGDWFNCGTYNDTGYESPNYFSYYTSYGKDEFTVYGCYEDTCGSDYEHLSIGDHTFALYATSVQGKVGQISYWNWTITAHEGFVLPEQGFTFEFAGGFDTDGDSRDVVVINDLAYVADYDEGFLILDVSDVSNINGVDKYKRSGFIYSQSIVVLDDYAYVAAGSKISVYDITNPDNIVLAGSYDIEGAPHYGIAVSGNYMYVAAGGDGLAILDISDITNITLLDIYNTDGSAYHVKIDGNYAYVADIAGLVVLDVSNPESIQFVGSYETEGQVPDVVVNGNYAYVAAGEEGLIILDISDSTNISFVSSYETANSASDVLLVGKYIFIADQASGVIVLDISDISNPEFVASYDTDGDAFGLTVTSNYVYVADNSNGLVVLEIVPNEIEEETEFPWIYTTNDDLLEVAISENGEYIVAGSKDDNVYFFETQDSVPLWNYTIGGDAYSVAISSDGNYVVVGSYDYNIYFFDASNNELIWTYATDSFVYSVAISSDGEYIVAGSSDDNVYFFHKGSSTPIQIYDTGADVWSVAISDTGSNFVAVGGSGSSFIHSFDGYDNGSLLWDKEIAGFVATVEISADGQYFATGSNSGKFFLFSSEESTPLWEYTAAAQIVSVDISADGQYLAAGSWDDKAYFFEKDSDMPLFSYDTGEDVGSVSLSANGNYLVVNSAWSPHVYFFNTQNHTLMWDYETPNVNGFSLHRSVSVSGDGKYSVSGSVDDNVYAFETVVETNVPPQVFEIMISQNPANYGSRVYFSGQCEDSDGSIVNAEWYSSIDGLISNSVAFDSDNLSVGSHNISFRVQDDDGAWSSYFETVLTIEDVDTIPDVVTTELGELYYIPLEGNELTTSNFTEEYGLLVNLDAYPGSESILDLNGTTVCVGIGTSVEFSLATYFQVNNLTYTAVNSADVYAAKASFMNGECASWMGRLSVLIEEESQLEQIGGIFNMEIMPEILYVNTNQHSVMTVNAIYEEIPLVRTNREPTMVASWYFMSQYNATVTIDAAEFFWLYNLQEYDLLCEWTFSIYHKGQNIGNNTVECEGADPLYWTDENGLQSPYPVNATGIYNINITFDVLEGDDVMIEVWYEGWDDIDLYYGNSLYPSGFYVTSLVVVEEEEEEECSFDTFMGNIYTKTMQDGWEAKEYDIGRASYHFVSEDNVYIFWDEDYGTLQLDNSEPRPSTKLFTETTFDYENRTFIGKIDWSVEGTAMDGDEYWYYQMIFSEDYSYIEGGSVIMYSVSGDRGAEYEFGASNQPYPAVFHYYALCTPSAIDYYEENHIDEASAGDSDTEVSFSLPDNSALYGLLTFTVGAMIAAGLVEWGARNSIPQIVDGLQRLVDAGISDSEINDALSSLQDINGLNYFSEDRTNALNLLTNYETMTGDALNSMAQLDELQGIVSELEASGVSSPELEAEISEIESMISEQLQGDTSEDYSDTVFDSFKSKKGGN